MPQRSIGVVIESVGDENPRDPVRPEDMAQTTGSLSCPEASVLSRYVLGTLDEATADDLAGHVDRCPRCQQRVDRLATQSDHRLIPVGRAGVSATADPAELARLIERAQRIGTRADKPGPSATVAPDVFVDCLRKSGLLDPTEIDALVDADRPASSGELARELVAGEMLTPFQARALLRGRWK